MGAPPPPPPPPPTHTHTHTHFLVIMLALCSGTPGLLVKLVVSQALLYLKKGPSCKNASRGSGGMPISLVESSMVSS